MPRVSKIAILKQREQPTLVVRQRTKVEKLPILIGQSYQRIGEYMGKCGELLTDVPFVAYHNLDMQDLDVEIGFPVSIALPGKGNIHSASIAEGIIAFCIYQGAYHEIEPVYHEMLEWIDTHAYQALCPFYEYYYTGPDEPESTLLTKIVIPIKSK